MGQQLPWCVELSLLFAFPLLSDRWLGLDGTDYLGDMGPLDLCKFFFTPRFAVFPNSPTFLPDCLGSGKRASELLAAVEHRTIRRTYTVCSVAVLPGLLRNDNYRVLEVPCFGGLMPLRLLIRSGARQPVQHLRHLQVSQNVLTESTAASFDWPRVELPAKRERNRRGW